MTLPYRDRAQAGAELGAALEDLGLDRPIVLGVPRGGVAIAAPAAEVLGAPLDVVVVRKLGAPGNPELGIGAVGPWGEPWLDAGLVARLGVERSFIDREVAEQRAEALRRVEAYRSSDEAAPVGARNVIVVDDGIATGGTVTAAARLLRAQEPERLVLAVPVAPVQSVGPLRSVYDDVVVLHTPQPYFAVGQWFDDFHQVTDDEVRDLLARRP